MVIPLQTQILDQELIKVQQEHLVTQVLQEQVEVLVQEHKEELNMEHIHLHTIDLDNENEIIDVSLIVFSNY